MAQSGVLWSYIRIGRVYWGTIAWKSGRQLRQDKSREVRLGRSGRLRLSFSHFDEHWAMCGDRSRCEALPSSPELLTSAHIAVFS